MKPDVRAFEHVLDALAVVGPEVFFTDDSAAKLTGADHLSLRVHLFKSVVDVRDELVAAGVAVRRPDTIFHMDWVAGSVSAYLDR